MGALVNDAKLKQREFFMTVLVSKKIADYFKSADKMTVAVNGIASYMSLDALKGFSLLDEGGESVQFEIDETNITVVDLKNEKLFLLVALYAMSMGE